MRRRLGAALAAAVATVLLLGTGAPAAFAATTADPAAVARVTTTAAASDSSLSESGDAAIADIRTCLASQDVLNVYYLIDNSQSLRVQDDGVTPGSDPDVLRAAILANSLEQLGSLGEDTAVNWAAGFFSTDFSADIGWQQWQEGSPDQLGQAISSRTPNGYTNWIEALDGAQSQLAVQQRSAPGCQVVVWLTDGAYDVGDAQANADGLNALCGARIDADGDAPEGFGIFNTFRQSGVVVLGVLLAADEAASDKGQVMRPLVEGAGEVDGSAVGCGQQPMPSSYVHGAFLEADSPSSLAQVFLQLSAQVGGGYPAPFDADGRFWVDAGVSRFRVVLGEGAWTLTPPADSGLDPASDTAPQSWASIDARDGSSVIDVSTTDAAARGQWQLTSGDTRSLFLFSDLSIRFDETGSIELDANGQAAAVVTGRVVSTSGDPADLTAFGRAEFRASLPGESAEAVTLDGAELDLATGSFTIPLPSDISASQLTVTAAIDPLVTAAHQLTLAPVSAQQTVTTVLPSNFPRVATVPVQLDPLEGADGQARGAITVLGPADGGDGRVCVREDPSIVSDAADRAGSWEWDLAADLDGDGCIAVPQGSEGVRISIAAANPTAADSTVQASIPVTFVSGAGAELTQDVPVVFPSTRPVNAAAVGLLALGLLVLGILVPLVLLWLVNWYTTRLELEPNTQRAALALRIGARETVFPTAPGDATALGQQFGYQPPRRNVRTIDDPALGTLRARVPWFPLRETWYEIVPPAGAAVLSARTGRRAGSEGVRRADGTVRFRQLPLDAFSAVVVRHDELSRTRRGDDVDGTAVFFHRPDPSDPSQYRSRLAEIEVDGQALHERADRQRGQIQDAAAPRRADAPASTSSAPGTTVPAPSSPAPSPSASVPAPSAPTRPGSSTTPPRPAPVQGTGSVPPPPPRSGTVPPPPPRPGR
ncbi:hypothetical protein ACFM35_09095 [Microbacterium sp. P01]|uniref:hypothetical protein n=1 Tax=Microbacterium sp. P01 TaxID=3366261 RepID=UPI00366B7487